MSAPVTTSRRPIVGLDVGGTSMKGLLVLLPDGPGSPEVVTVVRNATPVSDGVDAVVAAMHDTILELVAAAAQHGLPAPDRAGVVVPGIVDEVEGIARSAVNLGFRDLPLAALLGASTGLDISLGHDVRAGGIAEARLGAARGGDNVLFVPLGTGIAASCVVDGRALMAAGYAGELGHVIVRPGGEPCPCGQVGCLERYASASAVARHYMEAGGDPVDGSAEVATRLEAGDPIARAVWDDAVDALVTALLLACSVLGPAVVVIGGGLAQAGEALLGPVRSGLLGRMTFHRRPSVVAGGLGDQAGALGAALIADAHARGGVAP
jgi:glucokinase